jgi:hypothetical protein
MTMKHHTTTQTPAQIQPPCTLRRRLGLALTALVVLFLAFDAITKIIRIAPVMDACQKMGITPNIAASIGSLLLACTLVYVVPRTSILGAILLTGYLGGATATHIIQHSGLFPAAFAIGFGALVWAGLLLRQPRLSQWIFIRMNSSPETH